MPLPKKFDRRLKNRMGFHAAWPPTLTNLTVGSIVRRKNGVFEDVGHLDNRGIKFGTRNGSAARIDFSTDGISAKTTQGGAEVSVEKIDLDASASVGIDVKKQDSFLIKTDRFQVKEMTNELKVGLNVAAKLPNWNHKTDFIVRNVASGQDVTFIASAKKNKSMKLSGSGKAVFDFVSIGLSAGLNKSGSSNVSFSVLGGSGPVGIQIFRVKQNGMIVLD